MSRSGTDIGNRQAVDQDMHQVVDNDDQPARDPGRRIRIEPGRFAFGPGSAAGPGSILKPGNMPSKVPAIDDKMRASDHGERQRVLRDEQKREHVKNGMYECGKRTFRFLFGHPLALQQVVAHAVRNKLIDRKHASA